MAIRLLQLQNSASALWGADRVDRRLKQLLPRREDPPCSSRGGK